MKIPFSPPLINEAVIAEVTDALSSGWITTGPKVKALEEMVCEYTNAPKTLCVNSAPSGLMLALKWYGIGKGDEVIAPDNTFFATIEPIVEVGAKPVRKDHPRNFHAGIS